MTVSIYGATRPLLAALALLTLSACMATTSTSGDTRTWREAKPATSASCPCCKNMAKPCCGETKSHPFTSPSSKMGCCAGMTHGKDGMGCGGMMSKGETSDKAMMCHTTK